MVSPALIWPELDVTAAAVDGRLARRCKRASRRTLTERRLGDLIAAALGVEPPPPAAVARFADGLEAQVRHWFLAEAVMLIPDRDGARVMTLDTAPLDGEEMAALCATATAHFGERLVLECGASGRWYAALADVQEAHCESPRVASGGKLTVASLAQGRDAARLRGFLNELQMLWFEHPVNLARRAAGRPEANALWLWGGGRLPAKPILPEPVVIHAAAPEIADLALWLGVAREPLDESVATRPTQGTVVAIDASEEACGDAWLAAFASLEAGWRLYIAGSEWRIPPRRRFFRWGG